MKRYLGSGVGGFLVLVAVALVFFQEGDQRSEGGNDGKLARAGVGQFEGRFSEVRREGAGLECLRDCQLIPGRNSDGDSFHLKHEKGENEFRLYFVDAPESAYREYRGGETNGERLDEQGEYFDGLTREEAVAVGKEAKDFVLAILDRGDFAVLTKWEDVYGPGRDYCFVIVPWEGREVYLHELLVAQGLARVHTRGADLPAGRGWREQKEFLRGWEKVVKEAGIGAWGW